MTSKTSAHSGIILRMAPLNDQDRFITLYTQNEGKITCIAKGIRSIKSRRAAHTEPLNHIQASLWKSPHNHYLTECKTIERFMEAKQTMSSMSSILFMGEALDKLTEDESMQNIESQALFSLLRSHLEWINFYPQKHQLFREIFILKLLKMMGHIGSFRHCGKCHQKLPLKTAYFDPHSSIIIGEECVKTHSTFDMQEVPLDTLKLIHFMSENSPESCLSIELNPNHVPILQDIGRLFLRKNLHYPLRSEAALTHYETF